MLNGLVIQVCCASITVYFLFICHYLYLLVAIFLSGLHFLEKKTLKYYYIHILFFKCLMYSM